MHIEPFDLCCKYPTAEFSHTIDSTCSDICIENDDRCCTELCFFKTIGIFSDGKFNGSNLSEHYMLSVQKNDLKDDWKPIITNAIAESVKDCNYHQLSLPIKMFEVKKSFHRSTNWNESTKIRLHSFVCVQNSR